MTTDDESNTLAYHFDMLHELFKSEMEDANYFADIVDELRAAIRAAIEKSYDEEVRNILVKAFLKSTEDIDRLDARPIPGEDLLEE